MISFDASFAYVLSNTLFIVTTTDCRAVLHCRCQ